MRLIDADALTEKFTNANASGINLALDRYAVKCIEDAPTIKQPEIIFCKDCKWSDWYDAADGHRYCYCMETGAAGRTSDDFCSYAEREKHETD